jgi:hypothetical protein
MDLRLSGGQGRNRTTDTRIFSRATDRLRPYSSKSYRGVRCTIRTTMHNDAQLIHAKLTQSDETAVGYLCVRDAVGESTAFGERSINRKYLN